MALLLDATVIRSVVLPSLMRLLGEWNWYLPRWLDWLPRLEVEGRLAKHTRSPRTSQRAWYRRRVRCAAARAHDA